MKEIVHAVAVWSFTAEVKHIDSNCVCRRFRSMKP